MASASATNAYMERCARAGSDNVTSSVEGNSLIGKKWAKFMLPAALGAWGGWGAVW